ncbi:MAG: glycosyltransferase family 10 domain-containing protein [Candidatus Fonsibacter ubiquis]
MKTKFNLVGNTFTHLTNGNKGYSVHGKESKTIKWKFDSNLGISFYIDNQLDTAFVDDVKGIKYGWLLECKFIIPEIMQNVKTYYKKYFEVFRYIFTNDKELLNLDSRFKWCPAGGFWIKDPKIYIKSKLISCISSNKSAIPGHLNRLKWIDKISNRVDLYGRGFNEIVNKEDGLCDYMFSVAIENSVYNTYFTEKILDCFATGTIPIYLGTSDIGEHFNNDGIILLTNNFDISEDLYYNKMDAIKDNLQRVKKFEILEDFIFTTYDIV